MYEYHGMLLRVVDADTYDMEVDLGATPVMRNCPSTRPVIHSVGDQRLISGGAVTR